MTIQTRVPWDNYFLHIADEVAKRSTCDRAIVGCVLVKDKRILATGYNGSLPDEPHCNETDHLMMNDHCVRTVHGEANAVAQAAKYGISLEGATCYCTHSPCWVCFKLLVSAGIKRIVFSREYRWDKKVLDHANRLGIFVLSMDQAERSPKFRVRKIK